MPVYLKKQGLKNLIILLFFLLSAKSICCQDSIIKKPASHYFINFYPSTLINGSISFGAEHRYKKYLSHELSIGIRAYPYHNNPYDKGYRLDYLVKFNIYSGDIFRFSANFSFMNENFYFNNKNISYYYTSFNGPLTGADHNAYEIIREDRHLKSTGAGIGFSLNFKLYKKLFIGGDVIFNLIKNTYTYNLKELIYGNPAMSPYRNPYFPYTIVNSGSVYEWAPYLRLKLSYRLR